MIRSISVSSLPSSCHLAASTLAHTCSGLVAPAITDATTGWATSCGRATPLDRDIRISNSREQIEQLLAEMKSEYIVKGWAPAG